MTVAKNKSKARDSKLRKAHLKIKALEFDLTIERSARVSAQRGLVAYMREHGLAERIGYDPDADPLILKEIARGRIPASNGAPNDHNG